MQWRQEYEWYINKSGFTRAVHPLLISTVPTVNLVWNRPLQQTPVYFRDEQMKNEHLRSISCWCFPSMREVNKKTKNGSRHIQFFSLLSVVFSTVGGRCGSVAKQVLEKTQSSNPVSIKSRRKHTWKVGLGSHGCWIDIQVCIKQLRSPWAKHQPRASPHVHCPVAGCVCAQCLVREENLNNFLERDK